jgi:hypothetical protein
LIVPERAFNVVPVAVAKLKKPVEVPFVNKKFVAIPFVVNEFVVVTLVPMEFVKKLLVAKRLVEVVFVPVALVQVRFVGLKLVAEKLVTNKVVAVALVKTPVDGVVAPIVVPLIEPPVIVTFEEASVGAVRLVIVPLVAKKFAPVADVNESEVIVPLFEFKVEIVPFVAPKEVAKMPVEVTLVPVAFVNVRVPSEVAPETARVVSAPFVANRFVEVTFVNTPVDGTVAPIVAPLMVPPEIVAFDVTNVGAVNVVIVPLVAKKFVPVAEVNDSELIVPFVASRFVDVTFANTPFQRSAPEPSDNVASAVGSKLLVTPPVTAKKEDVPLVSVVF